MTDITIVGSETAHSELREHLSQVFPQWDISTEKDSIHTIEVRSDAISGEQLRTELETGSNKFNDDSYAHLFINMDPVD
jgi:hypothetical protein